MILKILRLPLEVPGHPHIYTGAEAAASNGVSMLREPQKALSFCGFILASCTPEAKLRAFASAAHPAEALKAEHEHPAPEPVGTASFANNSVPAPKGFGQRVVSRAGSVRVIP